MTYLMWVNVWTMSYLGVCPFDQLLSILSSNNTDIEKQNGIIALILKLLKNN